MNSIKIKRLGQEVLQTHIDCLLQQTSASVYWKEKSGKYLGVNDNFLQVAAVERHDLISATDMDLIWKDYAHLMMKNDQTVIAGELVNTYIEPSITPTGNAIHFLSHKTPLRNNKGKVIGVLGISYELKSETWDMNRLNEVSVLLGAKASDDVRKFILRQRYLHQLSNRQVDCLYYLSKCMTIKQIGLALSLSPRTVEHYIEAIKIKLNCNSKSDLISKICSLG